MDMIKSSKLYKGDKLSYDGCSCHNTKRDHRITKKAVKAAEKKQWKREALDG